MYETLVAVVGMSKRVSSTNSHMVPIELWCKYQSVTPLERAWTWGFGLGLGWSW